MKSVYIIVLVILSILCVKQGIDIRYLRNRNDNLHNNYLTPFEMRIHRIERKIEALIPSTQKTEH